MTKTKIPTTQEPWGVRHKVLSWVVIIIILGVLAAFFIGTYEAGFFKGLFKFENSNTNTNLAENPSVADNTPPSTGKGTCPATSCEGGSCCCDREVYSGFVICRVLDDNVQIPISCDCPSDTHYIGTIDVQGIPAKDCACNECPASCST